MTDELTVLGYLILAALVAMFAPLAVLYGWFPKRRPTIGGAMAVIASAGLAIGVLCQPARVHPGLWWLAVVFLYAMPLAMAGIYAPRRAEVIFAIVWLGMPILIPIAFFVGTVLHRVYTGD